MSEKIKPIYSGAVEDFHWAGFGSGSGTNLRECAKVLPPALIFSDRPKAPLLSLEELADIPKKTIDCLEACGRWKTASGDTKAEAEYLKRSIDFDRKIVRMLDEFEQKQGYAIDLIVLGGYMRFVREPLLEAYQDRIINVHPAALDIMNGDGSRKYIGENAVYDALAAGEYSTRSSVIIVDEKEDHGEILVMGPQVKSWPMIHYLDKKNFLKRYAEKHQEQQKEISDWPALTTALRLIAEGRMALGTKRVYHEEWRGVYLDGKILPYEGLAVRMGGRA